MNLNGRAVVIKNSPVEFVVLGPMGGRDRILVRSENAGLDLIGKAISSNVNRGAKFRSNISLLFEREAQLNTVVSGGVSDARSDIDGRESSLAFAWRGHAVKDGLFDVHHMFAMIYRDLYMAYSYGDEEDVEFQISPLIYQCSLVSDKAIRSRRMLRFLLALYVSLGLGSSIWYLFRYFGY